MCEPEQTGVDPVGTVIPIDSGDVQWDIESDVLATVELIVPDGSLYPTDPGDLLAPYGNELFIRRGVTYGAGIVEWVSLGYYRILSVEQDDARGGPFRVSGQDRMWRLINNPRDSLQYNANETRELMVREVIAFASITATIEWDDPALRDGQIGRTIIFDNDKYDVLAEFIASLGKVWYWDYRGILVIKDPPNSNVPVWDVDAGENGVLVSMGRSISSEGVFNLVEVYGNPTDNDLELPPGAGDADGDINSPTWTGSKFGVVSKVVTDSLATVFTVNAMAKALLRASLGFPKSIDFSAVPNAALEPYDPVRVTLNGQENGVHILRKLTIPLTPAGAITAETREYVAS